MIVHRLVEAAAAVMRGSRTGSIGDNDIGVGRGVPLRTHPDLFAPPEGTLDAWPFGRGVRAAELVGDEERAIAVNDAINILCHVYEREDVRMTERDLVNILVDECSNNPGRSLVRHSGRVERALIAIVGAGFTLPTGGFLSLLVVDTDMDPVVYHLRKPKWAFKVGVNPSWFPYRPTSIGNRKGAPPLAQAANFLAESIIESTGGLTDGVPRMRRRRDGGMPWMTLSAKGLAEALGIRWNDTHRRKIGRCVEALMDVKDEAVEWTRAANRHSDRSIRFRVREDSPQVLDALKQGTLI